MGSTYRLKRKLNDEGVDIGGRRATENFCLIGTPLPPLEKSRDSGEFVPVWKQDVRDEQGRRRLHGAFTGGFSAGYFNTVGSKEGWTPQTFVSSRNDRAKKKAARPEDYMDEEDLAELRENQVKSGIQEKMDLLGGTQAELGRRGGTGDEEEDSLTRRIERTLLPATNDSPGARLLKKMGWRPGHGVGPRVTWRQRKVQDFQAQGKSLEGVDIDKLEDDDKAKKHMYPPRDTQVPKISRKENAFGLGYAPGAGLHQGPGTGKGHGQRKSGPALAAGFGLGALNEAEDDDIDVYDSTSHAGRSRMAYDVADHDADDTISIGGNATRKRPPTDTDAVDANARFWPDGTLVLKGFVPAANPVQTSQWFTLPEVPKGWKPNPQKVWAEARAKENAPPAAAMEGEVKGQIKMTAEERGKALGETPLPSAPRSVFEYLSAKDRERIQKIASSASSSSTLPAPPPSTSTSLPPRGTTIPYTPPDVAAAALKGYMPFTSDPRKQLRYTAYLHSQADASSPPKPQPGQTPDAFHQEMEEYAKSAALFKPMSGAMAGRFTSAAAVDNGPKIVEGLYQPVHQPSPPPPTEEEKAEAKERERREREEGEMKEGSKGHAARMGMYGPLTREVKPWQPTKLLCKRFGVKDPNPDVKVETPMPGVSEDAPAAPSSNAAASTSSWEPEKALAEAGLSLEDVGLSADSAGPGSGKSTRRNLENIGLGEDDDQGRDTLTYVRPPMDVFKAIFASDDEDSGDEGEGDEKVVDQGVDADGDARMKEGPVAGPSTTKARVNGHEEPIPVHLRMDVDAVDGAENVYNGNTTNGIAQTQEKVDIGSFKPTFIPRADRETKKLKDREKDKEKKSKKSKAIVSFDTEEDGGGGLSIAPKKNKDKSKDEERKRKKRRKEKERDEKMGVIEEDDEDMWVEKPPPEAVKVLERSVTRSESPTMVPLGSVDGQNDLAPRGRKRAVDFM